jgi:hypothetical protein
MYECVGKKTTEKNHTKHLTSPQKIHKKLQKKSQKIIKNPPKCQVAATYLSDPTPPSLLTIFPAYLMYVIVLDS